MGEGDKDGKKNNETYPRSETYGVECPMCKWIERTVILKNEDEMGQFISTIDTLKHLIKNGLTHNQLTLLQDAWNFGGSKVEISGCVFPLNDKITTTIKKKKGDKKEENKEERPIKQFTKTFADVIGLDGVKEELKDEIIIRTLDKKDADESNIELGCGFIIAGPSGIGKTMLSKTICNEPEFKDQMEFYGEYHVKDFTGGSQEDTSKKVTEFFDKIDQVAKNNGKTQLVHIQEIDGILRNDRNSVISDTRLNSFLAKTGIDNGQYIIIGTTNRPHLIPFPIIRRGRFKSLFAEGPREHEVFLLLKKYISELKMQKFSDDDYRSLAKNMHGYTGSDVQGIKTDIFKWYNRSIRKGIIPKDYILIKEDFGQFLKIDSESRLNVQNKIKQYVEKAESGEEEEERPKSRRQESDVLLPSQIKELVNKAHPTVRDLIPSIHNRNFDAHKGKTIAEIATINFSYIKWLAKDVYELPGIAARKLIDGKGEPLVDKAKDVSNQIPNPSNLTLNDMEKLAKVDVVKEKLANMEPNVEKKEEPKADKNKEPMKTYNFWCVDCGAGPLVGTVKVGDSMDFRHYDFVDRAGKCKSTMRYEEVNNAEKKTKELKKEERKAEKLPVFEYPHYWHDDETGNEGPSQATIKFLSSIDHDEELENIAISENKRNADGKYSSDTVLWSGIIEDNTFEKNKGIKHKMNFSGNNIWKLVYTIKDAIPDWTEEIDSDFTILKGLSVIVTDDYDGIRFSVVEDDIYKKLCDTYAKIKILEEEHKVEKKIEKKEEEAQKEQKKPTIEKVCTNCGDSFDTDDKEIDMCKICVKDVYK